MTATSTLTAAAFFRLRGSQPRGESSSHLQDGLNHLGDRRLADLSRRRLFQKGAYPRLPGFGEAGRGCSSITALLVMQFLFL
jgi:hypothetical protein